MEVGRACVDPAYRGGAVISILWSTLFKYIFTGKYDNVIGCGSIPLASGGRAASAICHRLLRDHLCPPALRVAPHRPFRLDEFGRPGNVRLGAWVCGEPAWDPIFNSADLLIMLPAARINRRYFDRYLREL
jgi:putative hemolysin